VIYFDGLNNANNDVNILNKVSFENNFPYQIENELMDVGICKPEIANPTPTFGYLGYT
jgi:hypothetical protein